MIDFTPDGLTLRLHFRSFGQESYAQFLRAKRLPESRTLFNESDESYTIEAPARFANLLGVDAPLNVIDSLDIPVCFFDDQRYITKTALAAKRFAVWSDCGLGKTLIELEFARQVVHITGGGRVLIITMNEIVNQFLDEAVKFYGDTLPIYRIQSRDALRRWCLDGCDLDGVPQAKIAITNYEKMNPESLDKQVVNEMRHLAGIILDESSRLKTGGGKQKWAIIKSCKGIEYKLSCTATPAPNDIMEFASQASFLEKMRTESEIIWTFFVRDSKSHRWTVKRHARKAFFEFMSSWSIYVRDPKRYGWRLNMEEIPPPETFKHSIDATPEQRAKMAELVTASNGQQLLYFDNDTNAIQRAKLSQVAKGFCYKKGGKARGYDLIPSLKPDFVAKLVRQEANDLKLQVLVWTVFDAESEILAGRLRHLGGGGCVQFDTLTGKTSRLERLNILERFRTGKLQVLVSRASMLGYGMNLQCCGSMIFSGWTDSFESYYQAVRRAYRYGQTKNLRVHLPIVNELESDTIENVFRKESEHNASIDEMETNYVAAMRCLTLKIGA